MAEEKKESFRQLIKDDMDWLATQYPSKENRHIQTCLRWLTIYGYRTLTAIQFRKERGYYPGECGSVPADENFLEQIQWEDVDKKREDDFAREADLVSGLLFPAGEETEEKTK